MKPAKNSPKINSPMEDVCSCGEPLVHKTSWTDANPGRRFMACEKYRKSDGCNKFSWVDPLACERCSQIIPGLLRNINSKETDLKTMETRVLEMKKTLRKLQIAIVLGLAVVLISFSKS